MARIVGILLIMALGVSGAQANPAKSVVSSRADVLDAFDRLVQVLDEPVGLRATGPVPALGLVKGDVVRSVNGQTTGWASGYGYIGTGALYLDVARGKRRLLVRVTIKAESQHLPMERTLLQQSVERIKQRPSPLFRAVTKNGAPSGVLVTADWLPWLEPGDIVRAVDRTAVHSEDAIIQAMAGALANDTIVVSADRAGQAFTVTLALTDPSKAEATASSLIGTIKMIDATTYEVPRALVDLVLADPMSVAKGARFVPAVKNGKPAGFKIYAVRPRSLYQTLGLTNGDQIIAVNGHPLTTLELAMDAFVKVAGTKQLTIELVRRGKPLVLEWRVAK